MLRILSKDIDVYLSDIQLKHKPTTKDIRRTSATILSNQRTLSLDEFAHSLTHMGKTTVLGLFPNNVTRLRKDNPILKQDVVMLDFDNDADLTYTVDDLLQDEFMSRHALFWYRTFSDEQSNQDKFRVVFLLDTPALDTREVSLIYDRLFSRYPQADSRCSETTRLFFGSNQGFELFDWNNTLDERALSKLKPRRKKEAPTTRTSKKQSNKFISTESIAPQPSTWQVLKLTAQEVKTKKARISDKTAYWESVLSEPMQRLGRKYANKFQNRGSALHHFKTLDMGNILELPSTNPFNDIFHDESSPSASVFTLDDGTYYYKCFSESSNFQGDIVAVVSKLTGLSYLASIDLLIVLTGSEIIPDSNVSEIMGDVHVIEKRLLSPNLEETLPYTHTLLKTYIKEIVQLLNILSKVDIEDNKGSRRVISFYSIPNLQEQLFRRLGYKVSTKKLYQVINMLALLGFIHKLKDDELPKTVHTLLKKHQYKNDYLNRSDAYEIKPIPMDFFEIVEERSFICVENSLRVYSLSSEKVVRTFGVKFAENIFTQTSFQNSRGEVQAVSNKSLALEKKAVEFIEKAIEEKGYVFEYDILKHIVFKAGSRNKAQTYWGKMRNDICNKYALQRKNLNKTLQKELDIEWESTKRPALFIKVT